jgi:chromate transporter
MAATESTPINVAAEPSVDFATALRFWFKLGFINFGGPAGQIAIMHRELVEQRKWLSEERFLHALNFCMLLPGPEAQQLATYIGWLKHGIRGGIVAGVLFVLPGFFLVVAISLVYARFGGWTPLQGVLFGIKAAVLAIVIEALLRISKRALANAFSWWVAAAAFVAIFLFAVPFPAIVLVAGILGWFFQRHKKPGALKVLPSSGWRRFCKLLLVCSALWFTPILIAQALLGSTHVLVLQGWFFSKMAVVTFGGAYAALAYVAQQAVENFGWLNSSDMLQGLGLAETTPGPLILVLTFVGFLGAYHNAAPFHPIAAGLLGATLTTWVTFAPCFLWIFLGAPYVERLRQIPALSAALATITAAVVGVILNLTVWFALHALFLNVHSWQGYGLHLSIPQPASLDVAALGIAGVAAIALLRFKWPMLAVLALSAALGLLFKLW